MNTQKKAGSTPYPLCHTDVTVLYGLLRAMVKHDRKLATLQEVYPFCLQDPRNVRWVMSRLKHRLGLVTTQRVRGVGVMWVWCGKKSLRQFLGDVLTNENALRSRPEKAHRMASVKDMLKALKKIKNDPKSKTVHVPEAA